MVIRQLVDPYFHILVQDAYDKSVSRGVFSDFYAGTHRDEYLAEAHIISLGIASVPYARVRVIVIFIPLIRFNTPCVCTRSSSVAAGADNIAECME